MGKYDNTIKDEKNTFDRCDFCGAPASVEYVVSCKACWLTGVPFKKSQWNCSACDSVNDANSKAEEY